MALFLLALAAWLGVRSADCRAWTRITLLITTGVLLAAADAVKYATALFTPVVIVVIALTVWRKHGGSAGIRGRPDGAWLMALGGRRRHYARRPRVLAGITTTTLARPQSIFRPRPSSIVPTSGRA